MECWASERKSQVWSHCHYWNMYCYMTCMHVARRYLLEFILPMASMLRTTTAPCLNVLVTGSSVSSYEWSRLQTINALQSQLLFHCIIDTPGRCKVPFGADHLVNKASYHGLKSVLFRLEFYLARLHGSERSSIALTAVAKRIVKLDRPSGVLEASELRNWWRTLLPITWLSYKIQRQVID